MYYMGRKAAWLLDYPSLQVIDANTYLSRLHRYMEEHKKLPQPAEGSRYAIYKDTI